jgi:DNA-binding NarL/FixJ family response regulator
MTEDPTRIRVLCVDDHPIVRQGIATLLSVEADMAFVAEAADGSEAIQQFRACRPDVTLMDLQMPRMSGLDAIAAIRAEFPDARIIVLTTYAGDAQAQRALQAGARGYLLKNALHKELLDAIRAVHAGRKVLPSEVSFEVAGQVTDDTLTPAEISLLRFIAQDNAYQQIAISTPGIARIPRGPNSSAGWSRPSALHGTPPKRPTARKASSSPA